MGARSIIPKDIIEVSYLLLPRSKNLPADQACFNARAYHVEPVEDLKEVFPYVGPLTDGNRKDWLLVYWEQRSAGRKGVVLVPPDGTAPEILRKLPRVKLVRRPK